MHRGLICSLIIINENFHQYRELLYRLKMQKKSLIQEADEN